MVKNISSINFRCNLFLHTKSRQKMISFFNKRSGIYGYLMLNNIGLISRLLVYTLLTIIGYKKINIHTIHKQAILNRCAIFKRKHFTYYSQHVKQQCLIIEHVKYKSVFFKSVNLSRRDYNNRVFYIYLSNVISTGVIFPE